VPISIEEYHEKLSAINKKRIKLKIHPETESIIIEIKSNSITNRHLREEIAKIEKNLLTDEQIATNKLLIRERRQLRRNLRQYDKKIQEAESLIIGAEEEKKKVTEQIQNIQSRVDAITEQIEATTDKQISQEDEERLTELKAQKKTIDRKLQKLKSTKKIYDEDYKRVWNTVKVKAAFNKKSLTDFEKMVYKRVTAYDILMEQYRELNRSAPRRTVKSTFQDGEYYLSFRPEVKYDSDGNFQRKGIVSLGATFTPANINALSITLSYKRRI
jgi:DNA repair exonuclease SbcCD ATPase subunit